MTCWVSFPGHSCPSAAAGCHPAAWLRGKWHGGNTARPHAPCGKSASLRGSCLALAVLARADHSSSWPSRGTRQKSPR